MGRYVDVKKLKIQRIVFDGAIYDCVPMNALFEMAVENVEPVVHAHWIRRELTDDFGEHYWTLYFCSNCDYKTPYSEFRYCPDCGAKMDEGVE